MRRGSALVVTLLLLTGLSLVGLFVLLTTLGLPGDANEAWRRRQALEDGLSLSVATLMAEGPDRQAAAAGAPATSPSATTIGVSVSQPVLVAFERDAGNDLARGGQDQVAAATLLLSARAAGSSGGRMTAELVLSPSAVDVDRLP